MSDDTTKKAADDIANLITSRLDNQRQLDDEKAKQEAVAAQLRELHEDRINNITESVTTVLVALCNDLNGNGALKATIVRDRDAIPLDSGTVIASRLVRLRIWTEVKPDFGRKLNEKGIKVEIGLARGKPHGAQGELLFVYSSSDDNTTTSRTRRRIDPSVDPLPNTSQVREFLLPLAVESVKQ